MNTLKTTIYQRILNILSLATLISTFVYLTITWNKIPSKIPAHYNASGIIDRWGDKKEIWFIFSVTVLMFLMLSLVEHFPKVWNTGITVTKINQEKVYKILKSMLITIKFLVILIFIFIIINSVLVKNLPSYFTELSLCLIFGTIIIFGIRLYLNKNI